MILTIASTKGGVGKSTLTINLAVALGTAGRSVFLIDADRQGTLSSWGMIRESEGLPPMRIISATGDTLQELANDKSKQGAIVLIDTTGADTRDTRNPIACADAIITISAPTPADLWELDRLDKIIDRISKIKGKRTPWYLVLNRVHPSTKDLSYVQEYLSDSSIYPTKVFDTPIRQRMAYVDAIGAGRGVSEMKDDKATKEIQDLCTEILNTIGNE